MCTLTAGWMLLVQCPRDTFNEQDMMHDFNTSNVVKWLQRYDSSRMVDTDSGGPDNSLHVGNVDDLHVGGPNAKNGHKPSPRQYMMDGEYGNIEFWIDGHTWTNSADKTEVCRLYGNPDASHPMISGPPHGVAVAIAGLANAARVFGNLSVASYVQLTGAQQGPCLCSSSATLPSLSPPDGNAETQPSLSYSWPANRGRVTYQLLISHFQVKLIHTTFTCL